MEILNLKNQDLMLQGGKDPWDIDWVDDNIQGLQKFSNQLMGGRKRPKRTNATSLGCLLCNFYPEKQASVCSTKAMA